MAGDWYVAVHVTLPDGRKLDRQFEIKGVAGVPRVSGSPFTPVFQPDLQKQ